MRLLFQISVLLLTLQRGTSTGRYYKNRVTIIVYASLFVDSCLPEDHRKIRLTGPRRIKNEGAVQLCVRTSETKYLWYYIQTQDSWRNNRKAAKIACRELGLSYIGA